MPKKKVPNDSSTVSSGTVTKTEAPLSHTLSVPLPPKVRISLTLLQGGNIGQVSTVVLVSPTRSELLKAF